MHLINQKLTWCDVETSKNIAPFHGNIVYHRILSSSTDKKGASLGADGNALSTILEDFKRKGGSCDNGGHLQNFPLWIRKRTPSLYMQIFLH